MLSRPQNNYLSALNDKNAVVRFAHLGQTGWHL